MKILDVVKGLLSKGLLAPTNNGKPAELVLIDFLPGTQAATRRPMGTAGSGATPSRWNSNTDATGA